MFRNKVLALTLAMVFVLSISAVAFAANTSDSDVDFEITSAITLTVDPFPLVGDVVLGGTNFETVANAIDVSGAAATDVTVYAEEDETTWPTGWTLVDENDVDTTDVNTVGTDKVAVAISPATDQFLEADPISVDSLNPSSLGGLAEGSYEATVTVGVGSRSGTTVELGLAKLTLHFTAID